MSAFAVKAGTAQAARCRGCHAPIVWVETVAGKRMPLDRVEPVEDLGGGNILVDSSASHWATCPNVDDFRRKKR